MATRPSGATDYASAQSALVTTPLDAQIKSGFVVSQPSVHLLNGVFRRLFRWIEYLNGVTVPDETGGISLTYAGRAIQLPFPLVGANDAAKLASAQIFKREEKTLAEGGTGASIWAGSGAVTEAEAAVKRLDPVYLQTSAQDGLFRTQDSGDDFLGERITVRSIPSYRPQAATERHTPSSGVFYRLYWAGPPSGGRYFARYQTRRGRGSWSSGTYAELDIQINSSGNLIFLEAGFPRVDFDLLNWGSLVPSWELIVQKGNDYAVWDIPRGTDSRYNDEEGYYASGINVAPKIKSSGFNIASGGEFTFGFIKSASETSTGGAGSRLTTSGALSLSNSPPFSLINYQYTGGKIVLTFAAAVTATSFDSVSLARGATTLLTLAASDASFSTSAPFTASWTAADVASAGGTITFTFSKGGAGLAVAEWNAVASTAENFGIFVDSAGDHYLRINFPSGISNNDKLFIRRAPAA